MHNVQQQFKKNHSLWTETDKEVLEQFFLSNIFFSKFYQNKKLTSIGKICRYCKLGPGEKLLLENNNRAQAIVLLNGECVVKKKEVKIKKIQKVFFQNKEQKLQKGSRRYEQSPSNHEEEYEYAFLAKLTEFNQTLTLNSESMIEIPQNRTAQIIFVPCALYYQLQEQIQQERVEKIAKVLEKFFFRLKKKEFKMNNYIYRAVSKPEEVYLLLEGMVKLEKPGFSQQTLKENILLNPGMIFGEKDIKLQERTRNAVTCTAHVEVLTIPKIPFLKFAPKAFPELVFEQDHTSLSKLPKLEQGLRLSHSVKVSPVKRFLLPNIRRSHFHETSLNAESKKSESEQKRQYDLIRNSHILLDMNLKKQKKFELRKFSPKTKEQMKVLLKNQKSKLKQLKIQSRFSLNNSLLNL